MIRSYWFASLSAILVLSMLPGCARWNPLDVETSAPGQEVILPADGRLHRVASLHLRHGTLHPEELSLSGAQGRGSLTASSGAVTLWVRSPVLPRTDRLSVTHNASTRTISVAFREDDRPDADHTGLPDWMPLHSTEDRESFRRWFTAIAERAADVPPADLPAEISDCSALLRYSFREALRDHDDKWYSQLTPLDMPALRSVAQWTWPNTPMGTGLFRTRPGTFAPSGLHDGTFAQFADAKTLVAANTFFVSRNLARARSGDLIFYRLLEESSQYHSMIVTGAHGEWVVYHTGPITTPHGRTLGEMRRVLLADLIHHPDPRWRPVPTNANFLGIYRWDILDDNS